MAEEASRGRIVGDYRLEKQIGSGSFAVVWRARHVQHGYEVAVKEIVTEKLNNNKKLFDSLSSEIKILKQINHRNIVRLHDIVEASGRIYIVLEYCTGGDLAAYIQRHKRSSEDVARHFMIQLADGLQVLHQNNLMHRDLKPQNLLLSTNERNAVLKIADFGFARTLQPQKLAETLCGSPLYMAPEIMQNQKYDAKADLWSVGAILFQLVTGIPPFSGNSQFQLLQNILKSNELHFPPDIVGNLHPDCINLCRQLLRKNPVERLSFEEFFNHKFMIQARSMGGLDTVKRTPQREEGSPVVENAVCLQDDCLPSVLDKERLRHYMPLPSLKSTLPVSNSTSYPDGNTQARKTLSVKNYPSDKAVYFDKLEVNMNLEASTSNYDLQRSFDGGNEKELLLKVSQGAHVGQEHIETALSKGVVDSLECIEQEYVLVNANTYSTETFSSSLCASGLDQSRSNIGVFPTKLQKSTSVAMQIVGTAAGSVGGVESLESQTSIPSGTSQTSVDTSDMLENPSDHPPTRLQSLRRFAESIMELANEELDAGHRIEAFSIQMLCLAIWTKALHVSHNWASSFTKNPSREGLGNVDRLQQTHSVQSQEMSEEADFQAVAAACSQIEQEFLVAFAVAEQLASHLGTLEGNTEMPDAIEIVFQAALELGKKGAVKELYGERDNAAAFYLKSTTLLSFILVEASSLDLNPSFSLSVSDRQRFHRYIDCLTTHMHRMLSLQHENDQAL